MEQADRLEAYRQIGGLAFLLGKDLPKESLQIYCAALQDLSIDELKQAICNYLNGQNPYFPTPGQLRATIRSSDEDAGREVASRILEAIHRFGGRDHAERAKKFIGEIGWQVVIRHGGWEEISKITSAEVPTLKAQWRDLAISMMHRHRLGINSAPQFEKLPEKKLSSLSKVLQLAKIKSNGPGCLAIESFVAEEALPPVPA